MEVVIKILPENTEYKENIGCNVLIMVSLESIWDELKKNSRFCVMSTINVPIIMGNERKMQEQVITDFFDVADIERDYKDNPQVVQYGYYEGIYDETRKTVGSARVWMYDLIGGTE